MRALALAAGVLATLGQAGAEERTDRPNEQRPNVIRVEHRDPSTVPTRGHPEALVTVEYFFMPDVDAGRRLPQYKRLEALYEKHPARVRIVYRVVKGRMLQLAVAALEAHAQGKFFELMEALHANRSQTQLTKEQILELARSIGMDASRVANAIPDGRYNDVLAANQRRMEKLHAAERSVLFNSRVVRLSSTPTEAEFEDHYKAAYNRSLELIDQGYEPRQLSRIFDEQQRRSELPFVMSMGSIDDDIETDPTDHKLVKPPLDLNGLPSFGKPDATAPAPVVVLCRPNDPACVSLMRIVRSLVDRIFADEVRAVWGPWFDVQRDDAGDLALLADAELCAEGVGSSPDEMGASPLSASPGWRWISKQLDHANRSHGRRMKAETLINQVATELDIDSARLSACRARIATTSLDFIAKARKSGVARSPAIIIGGRIYEGLNNEDTIRKLIEAEVAPGVLGEMVDSQFERLLFFLSSPKGK